MLQLLIYYEKAFDYVQDPPDLSRLYRWSSGSIVSQIQYRIVFITIQNYDGQSAASPPTISLTEDRLYKTET